MFKYLLDGFNMTKEEKLTGDILLTLDAAHQVF